MKYLQIQNLFYLFFLSIITKISSQDCKQYINPTSLIDCKERNATSLRPTASCCFFKMTSPKEINICIPVENSASLNKNNKTTVIDFPDNLTLIGDLECSSYYFISSVLVMITILIL